MPKISKDKMNIQLVCVFAKEPYISVKEPYIPTKQLPISAKEAYWYLLIFQSASKVISQKPNAHGSFEHPQKSPIHPPNSPIYLKNIPIYPQNNLYIRKIALYIRQTALCICKRDLLVPAFLFECVQREISTLQ